MTISGTGGDSIKKLEKALENHKLPRGIANVPHGYDLTDAEKEKLIAAAELGADKLPGDYAGTVKNQSEAEGFLSLLSNAAATKQQELATAGTPKRREDIIKELIELRNLKGKLQQTD